MAKQRYRIISVIGIIVAICAIVLAILSMARQGGELFGPEAASGKGTGSNVLEVANASSVEIEGMWDVTITKGKPGLRLSADARQLEGVDFSQDGEHIRLGQGAKAFSFGKSIKAELSMPDLRRIRQSGAGSLVVDGFSSQDLKLEVQGGMSVTMRNSTIQNLVLGSEGACSVDMASSRVTNAVVDLQGASNAILTMAGGTLGGKIEGVGHLAYAGTVSAENVTAEGLAKVEKK